MRAFLGTGCAKGCVIYIFALALIIMVTSIGLGGLGARFGIAQVQGNKPDVSVPSLGPDVAAPQTGLAGVNADGSGGRGGGGLPVPTSAPPPTIAPPQIAPQPTSAPPPPSQGQGGTITGEVSPPFYIVQSGDSLWSIAHKLGISIDDLRAANNISGDLIYPGQILYLPAGTQAAGPAAPGVPTAAPAAGNNAQDQSQDLQIPTMPDTGITSRKP